MGLFTNFVVVYVFGGLTFIPLLVSLFLFYVFFTQTQQPPVNVPTRSTKESLQRPGDDKRASSKDGTGSPTFEKAMGRGYEAEVAAGYFAVCREYVPGGINGKPPERTTPAGAVVVAESPSVYQTMYRSLFDRNKTPTMESGKTARRGRNVFFVVLRHGHLLLFDTAEQLEVRHVISLEYFRVAIHSGKSETPEGQLWIRRNAILLEMKSTGLSKRPSAQKPFFLFSDNCSEKEDFYFALLQNQEKMSDMAQRPPEPQHFEVGDIISLVQGLHLSEEHLQTRWINALIGRLFLSLYKTPEVEHFVRRKITKKIARVKKPAFLSDIVLRKVYLGKRAPTITNPRLRDLNVDGDCAVEADITYAGDLRIEIAATARIDLGPHFKAREVSLVLAVVLRKLEGHAIIRLKPPPSNRFWVAFETMPKIDLAIEPIVSSRQITFNIILKAIESRIMEVIAETIVLPNWDDIPFTNTKNQEYRGGIWAGQTLIDSSSDESTDLAQESEETELVGKSDEESIEIQPPTLLAGSKAPQQENTPPVISEIQVRNGTAQGKSLGYDARLQDRRKGFRSSSFASVSSPLVSTDTTTVDALKDQSKRIAQTGQDAASVMIAITNRPRRTSSIKSPVDSPVESSSRSSMADKAPKDPSRPASNDGPATAAPSSHPALDRVQTQSVPSSPGTTLAKPLEGFGNQGGVEQADRSLAGAKSLGTGSAKRQSLPSIGFAANAAKRWSLGVFNKAADRRAGSSGGGNRSPREGTPERPIGRGQPLPPPGMPLPRPSKTMRKRSSIPDPSRSPNPPPVVAKPRRGGEMGDTPSSSTLSRKASTTSDESSRRRSHGDEGMFVVAAPLDSEGSSLTGRRKSSSAQSAVGDRSSLGSGARDPTDDDDDGLAGLSDALRRSQARRSSDDAGQNIPTWVAAQEGEARAKSLWVDSEHGGL
ncbi:MAG: hypothetical protein M1825_003714 [Sarcosagium campestre]|nr:MAG: hypothetical protein M1825_003714 [Sarcosagium campestre]